MTSTIHWLPLAAALCLPLSAAAQGATEKTSQSTPAPSPTVSTDLRTEYIAGEPLLVMVNVRNETASTLTFPDLAARPWLVRFEYARPGQGGRTSRQTTPPAEDPGQVWKIPPRAQRQTLLEVPGSGALDAGSYTMTVRIDTGSGELSLDPVTLELTPARPVAGDLGQDALGGERLGLQAPWLQQSSSGYELYLHLADAKNPARTIADYHLAHLDQRISPLLTTSRGAEGWARHVVWQSGSRSVSFARLNGEGLGLSGPPSTVETPWPKLEVVGRGATGTDGSLLVPIWVPGPKGDKGELRLVAVDDRGVARFRKVARFDGKPTSVVTQVDTGGSVNFVVVHGDLLDGYTIRRGEAGSAVAAASSEGLPVPGRRLWRAPEGETLLSAHFAFLTESEAYSGGTALLAVARSEAGVIGHWLTPDGREIGQTEPNALPAGATLLEVLPRSDMEFGYMARTSDGRIFYREGEAEVAVDQLASESHLVRDARQRPVLRELTSGGPVRARSLTLPETTP